MASANWAKIKGAGEAKAIMRHCDRDERQKHDHANKDIDKSKTSRNWSMNGLSYEQVCQEYDKRILVLDSQPGNVNKRKDRITYVGVDIPVPEGLPKDRMPDWFRRAWEIFQEQTKGAGIEGWVHVDEVHDYMHAGEIRQSREHMHIGAVPQIDGRLCAKDFVSRRNIIRYNKAVQDMSVQEFGVEWNDGSRKKSTETVEQLKNQSLRDMEAWENSLNARAEIIDQRESGLDERESLLDARTKEIEKQAERQDEQQKKLDESASLITQAVERVETGRSESKQSIVNDWIDGLRLPRFIKSRMKDSYQVHEIEQASAENRRQNEANKAAREAAEVQAILDEIETERKAEREKREREAEAYRKEMERLERNAAIRRQRAQEAAKKAEYDNLIAMGRKWRQEGAERVQAGRRIPELQVHLEPEQNEQELGG